MTRSRSNSTVLPMGSYNNDVYTSMALVSQTLMVLSKDDDVNMPLSNGYQLTREIPPLCPEIVLVFAHVIYIIGGVSGLNGDTLPT